MTHLLETFEMSIDHQEDGLVVISMPVTDKVKQPFGYLHGGASIALGETACSLGLEMNANHIHSAKDGRVIATAEIIHQGKSTHVWDIKIKNDKEQLITVMRGTVAIKPLK